VTGFLLVAGLLGLLEPRLAFAFMFFAGIISAMMGVIPT
jgi:hypothetical protein